MQRISKSGMPFFLTQKPRHFLQLLMCDVEHRKSAMILEVAALDVKPGQGCEFETTFGEAQRIIASMPGYVSHQLQKCIEKPDRYLLLVNWRNLEDHTVGFRKSEQYQEWRRLLHSFYEPFPVVEHYTGVYDSGQ